jgi:hypothetical protein
MMARTPPSGWFARRGGVYRVRLQTCVDIDADEHPKICGRNSKWRCSGFGSRGWHYGQRPVQVSDDTPPRYRLVFLVLVNSWRRGADELPGSHLAQCLDLLSRGTCDGHDGVPRLDLRGSFRVGDNLPNERPGWALQVKLRSSPSYKRGISGLCSFS